MSSSRAMLLTEQRTARVLLVDQTAAVVREWRPRGLPGWGLPNEAKPRRWQGLPVLLVTDSYGFVGVFDTDGALRWSTDVTQAADPHSIELLPGGELAVAGAVDDWVRVYRGLAAADAAAAGGEELLAEFPLPGAHGLVWDDGVLWAVGHHVLVALAWDGARLVERDRVDLLSAEGHDLAAAGRAGHLWVTTRAGVYLFDTAQRRWCDVPDDLATERDVKSIGDADGRVLYTRADEQWWTQTVRSRPPAELTFPDFRIYKARWAWEDLP